MAADRTAAERFLDSLEAVAEEGRRMATGPGTAVDPDIAVAAVPVEGIVVAAVPVESIAEVAVHAEDIAEVVVPVEGIAAAVVLEGDIDRPADTVLARHTVQHMAADLEGDIAPMQAADTEAVRSVARVAATADQAVVLEGAALAPGQAGTPDDSLGSAGTADSSSQSSVQSDAV